jgi:hypothetical protein
MKPLIDKRLRSPLQPWHKKRVTPALITIGHGMAERKMNKEAETTRHEDNKPNSGVMDHGVGLWGASIGSG